MTPRRLARLLAILGAVGVGWVILDARPREIVLVYDARGVPDATALEVELRRSGEIVRRARLRLDPAAPARHPVRLPDGTYVVAWRLERPGAAVAGEREIAVSGEETIVLPLGP